MPNRPPNRPETTPSAPAAKIRSAAAIIARADALHPAEAGDNSPRARVASTPRTAFAESRDGGEDRQGADSQGSGHHRRQQWHRRGQRAALCRGRGAGGWGGGGGGG